MANPWYTAEVKKEARKALKEVALYVCKVDGENGEPDRVRVWNGRWYRDLWTKEECRAKLVLGRQVPADGQERLNNDYSWYLNY